MVWVRERIIQLYNLWTLYFMIYSLLTSSVTAVAKSFNISFVNQTTIVNKKATTKFLLFITLLSLGGLPPFIGFLPKWTVIQLIIANNLKFILTTMVVISLATLYFYLRLSYSRFIILTEETKWNTWSSTKNIRITYGTILSSGLETRVRFPALPEKKSSGSGTGSTQPREYNWGATW
jgi:NADH-ubiquinone oxidoreductase chain 2